MTTLPKIPFFIIVADILGTVAAGIGVADAIAGIKLIPEEYRFPYYNWILMVVGFLLISLHSIYMVNVYRSQSLPDKGERSSSSHGQRLKAYAKRQKH